VLLKLKYWPPAKIRIIEAADVRIEEMRVR